MNSSLTQMQFMSTLRYGAFFVGNWLATHKYIPDADVNTIVSVVLIMGPPAWAWIDNYLQTHKTVAKEAAAVQAGIDLVVSGKALASDGVTVVERNDGSTPPKPVTVQTAQQIIKDFAPDPKAVPKA